MASWTSARIAYEKDSSSSLCQCIEHGMGWDGRRYNVHEELSFTMALQKTRRRRFPPVRNGVVRFVFRFRRALVVGSPTSAAGSI